MTADPRRVALEQTMMLGGLDDAVLDGLAQRATLRHYQRGQPVVLAGDPGGDLLVVARGRLKVLARSAEGNDLLLAHTGIGDLLGELTMFDHGPRSATVEAAEDADIVWLPGEAVIEVIRAHPDVAEELLRQLAETVRRVSGMVADLVFLDVPRRVAKFVLEHADGRGVADLGMSQGELAAAVGGVRQSVNTALRGLERRGWIRMEGRTIRIGDRDALAEFAGVGES